MSVLKYSQYKRRNPMCWMVRCTRISERPKASTGKF